jgi:hypothetical protein
LIDCLIGWLIDSFVRSFVCSCIRSFIHSFVRSFVHSFVPSFIRSFVASFLNLPVAHKSVQLHVITIFFCPIKKMCSFRGLKKGVRSSAAPHSNQPDSFSIRSLGHFCHARMHVQHAKCIRPRTATPDNMGCIAAHVNNRALDRVNLTYPPHHQVCFSEPRIP